MDRRLCVAVVLVALGAPARPLPAAARDEPPPGGADREAPVPPPCRHRHRVEPPRAAPMTPAMMPEFFARMGQQMAADPARGMQAFVDQMARFEGPALRDVRLTAAEERAIGREAREALLRRAAAAGHPVVRDERKLRYLDDLVETMSRFMEHRDRYPELHLTLVEADEPDAFCLPGGYLVFTTGLLDQPDEATVAGVVAHELAHLDRGHVYQYAKRTRLAEQTFAPGPGQSFDAFFTRGMALMGLMMNPYRPEHESEADCIATTWMYLAGYDPTALVLFFDRLHGRLNDRPDGAAPPMFVFARSHPFTLDRRREVLGRFEQLRDWRPRDDLALAPDNLRTLTSRLRRAREEAAERP